MARFYRRLAALIKRETAYGADSVPTGGANAIDLTDVTVDPLQGQEEQRDLLRPYFGNQGKLLTANHARVEFSVELAGSGTAGTAPAFGALLRACGMAEAITNGVSVAYLPVTANPESATAYFNLDGVQHIFLGMRGTWSLELTPQRIPRIRFQVWGLLGAVADVVLPAVTLTAWKRAIEVNKANTIVTLHGYTAVAERLAVEFGNQVEPRMLIGEESVQIVNRSVTGTAVFAAAPVATIDWIARARLRTRGALAAVHGTVAGNIATMAAAATEIGRPTYGQTQGIRNETLPFDCCPVTGDDELSLTFT